MVLRIKRARLGEMFSKRRMDSRVFLEFKIAFSEECFRDVKHRVVGTANRRFRINRNKFLGPRQSHGPLFAAKPQ